MGGGAGGERTVPARSAIGRGRRDSASIQREARLALLVVFEIVELFQILVLQLLVVEVLVVLEVLVLVVVVVEGKPVVVDVLVLFVKPTAHFQGLQRRLPGQHCILRQSERVGTRRPTTRLPPGRPGRPSCGHSHGAPACGGGCSWA